jgi:hypothetical protein
MGFLWAKKKAGGTKQLIIGRDFNGEIRHIMSVNNVKDLSATSQMRADMTGSWFGGCKLPTAVLLPPSPLPRGRQGSIHYTPHTGKH